jgi:hypothetical protein
MARHKSFPRFLSSACVSLRRLRLNTNHNMEAIFRLLEGRCCSLSSLEVLVFSISFREIQIYEKFGPKNTGYEFRMEIPQDLFGKKKNSAEFLFLQFSVPDP